MENSPRSKAISGILSQLDEIKQKYSKPITPRNLTQEELEKMNEFKPVISPDLGPNQLTAGIMTNNTYSTLGAGEFLGGPRALPNLSAEMSKLQEDIQMLNSQICTAIDK